MPDLDTVAPDVSGHAAHPALSYAFGVGDGEMSTWRSPADLDVSGDGVLDAVALDFDGDGRRDDAMWDSDGDGRADLAVLDRSGAVRAFSDTGRGLWDHRVYDAVPKPGAHGSGTDRTADHDGGRLPAQGTDLDGDGAADDRVVDTDGTGGAEVGLVFAGASDPTPTRLLVDLDGDHAFDAVVVDTNADGVADGWFTRGRPGFAASGRPGPRQGR